MMKRTQTQKQSSEEKHLLDIPSQVPFLSFVYYFGTSTPQYLFVVNFQIRHSDAVFPFFSIILSSHQSEDLPDGSGYHAWLLWAAQHGVGLT